MIAIPTFPSNLYPVIFLNDHCSIVDTRKISHNRVTTFNREKWIYIWNASTVLANTTFRGILLGGGFDLGIGGLVPICLNEISGGVFSSKSLSRFSLKQRNMLVNKNIG